MEELLDGPDVPKRSKRPVFLTVLCIHTWIGSAIVLYFSWNQYVATSYMLKELNYYNEIKASFIDSLRGMLFHSLVQMAGCVFCITGSILMWQQRKWGFYTYAIGELAALVAGLWFFWTIFGGHLAILEIFLAILITVVPVGFLVMYRLNFKYLR